MKLMKASLSHTEVHDVFTLLRCTQTHTYYVHTYTQTLLCICCWCRWKWTYRPAAVVLAANFLARGALNHSESVICLLQRLVLSMFRQQWGWCHWVIVKNSIHEWNKLLLASYTSVYFSYSMVSSIWWKLDGLLLIILYICEGHRF